MTDVNSRFGGKASWVLWLLAAVGLGARLWEASQAPWYLDEGYVAAIAQDLGAFRRPQVGALWANGLMPLTASWLAPLTAAPFTWFSAGQPVLGVRVWAALLGALSILGLGLLGRRLGGWSLGLASAALLALSPVAVQLGGLGLYHALGACLALGAFALAVEDEGPAWRPWALAGLAAAACYWLWWVPVGLALRRREKHLGYYALGFAPAALALGLAVASPGGMAMFRTLRAHSVGLQHWAVYLDSLANYPFAWVGVLSLLLLGRERAWLAAAVGLGFADALRQRGNLSGSPYILLPLLPWFALGLALAAQRLARASRVAFAAMLLVGFALFSVGSLDRLRQFSVPGPMVLNLRNFIRTLDAREQLVLTEPSTLAALRGVCRPAELVQAAAWTGQRAGLIPAGTPHTAFAFDPSLDRAAYLVLGRLSFGMLFQDEATRQLAQRALQGGWRPIFQNPEFRVYANPAALKALEK